MSLAQAARSMELGRQSLLTSTYGSVFISYTRVDRPRVERLVEVLSSQGITAWWDAHISVGTHFPDRIAAAIDAAPTVVVVWSPSSRASDWVIWEANRGFKQNKLVPLATDDLDTRDLLPPFNQLNTLRYGDDERLLAAIRQHAAQHARG